MILIDAAIEFLPNRIEITVDSLMEKPEWIKVTLSNGRTIYIRVIGKSINENTDAVCYAYNCIEDYYIESPEYNFIQDGCSTLDLERVYRWSLDGISLCYPLVIKTTDEIESILGIGGTNEDIRSI